MGTALVESGFGRETPLPVGKGSLSQGLTPRLSAIIRYNVVETARGDAASDDGAVKLERGINAVAKNGLSMLLPGCNANEKAERISVADRKLIFQQHSAKRNGFFLQGELTCVTTLRFLHNDLL